MYPSMRVLLTGDLTNHTSYSAILSDKQIRGESRLKLVFLYLKSGTVRVSLEKASTTFSGYVNVL